jgi:cyclic pyranopterin phosphate synthase
MMHRKTPDKMHRKTPDKSHSSTCLHPGQLTDNHGRKINYLRLAVTDRCNLRCRYCRPEKGVPFIPHEEILSLEELERLVTVFSALGISKVRVTGGEPFSRRGCLSFLGRLKQIPGVESLHITTNGVKTAKFLDEIADLGLGGINLSLDTLDAKRFWKITRRDYLPAVLETLHGALDRNIPLKVNSVVLDDTSDAEIMELADLARKYPLTLRFIERMPFSGKIRSQRLENGNLFQRLAGIFSVLEEYKSVLPTTARTFSLPGYKGKVGIIEGYARLFCATCNKIRITPAGMLKTCLYDNGALDLKKLLRSGANDDEIKSTVISCIQNRYVNGHKAEQSSTLATEPSMSKIGG